MVTMIPPISSNPTAIAAAGEKIYNEMYRQQYELEHAGKFVAINIRNEHASLGTTSDEALEQARQRDPDGLFHLIRVGSPGAFRVSYTLHADDNWFSR